jgi:PIN domain nuclease of toxin-antitoxin system
MKVSPGKLEFNADPIAITLEAGFHPLDYSAADAVLLKDLPFHHRDPFDHMLISQSIAQKTKLMSDDAKFTLYDCDLV